MYCLEATNEGEHEGTGGDIGGGGVEGVVVGGSGRGLRGKEGNMLLAAPGSIWYHAPSASLVRELPLAWVEFASVSGGILADVSSFVSFINVYLRTYRLVILWCSLCLIIGALLFLSFISTHTGDDCVVCSRLLVVVVDCSYAGNLTVSAMGRARSSQRLAAGSDEKRRFFSRYRGFVSVSCPLVIIQAPSCRLLSYLYFENEKKEHRAFNV